MAFNSHAKFRTETVSLRVSDANVRVYKINDIDGEDEEEDLPIQISPVFDAEGQVWPPTQFFSIRSLIYGLVINVTVMSW